MLFYNEQDEICLKDGERVKVLYDRDYFELQGKWYTYSNGYFYDGVAYGDGDYETDWEKRTHPRHMGIVEMDEAFAKPSYKTSLDDLFEYKEGISEHLNEEAYFVMYTIDRKIDEALSRARETASVSIKAYEFDRIKEEGLLQILGLLKEEYPWDLHMEEDVTKDDRAYLTIFLD